MISRPHTRQHEHDHHSGHYHDHHAHAHGRILFIALGLTLFFALIEAIGGWLSGSLALIGDAGHMLSDSLALGLAAVAAVIAARPPTDRLSYGFGRVEVVAALVNVLLMFGVVFWIVFEAWHRFQSSTEVNGELVMLIAFIGLLVNLLVAWILHHGEQTLNTRAAILHVMGDLLGSVAALFSGLVISLTGWTPIDPILSLFIGALILVSSVRMLKETLHLLLEGVPPHINLEEVGNTIAACSAHVSSVHDLHVWAVSSQRVMLSAHVIVDVLGHWPEVRRVIEQRLLRDYGIDHITLQPETVEASVAVGSIRRTR